MKGIICCLAFILGAPVWACGTWRWGIKTGTDPQALHIDVNSAIHVAITDLTALPIQVWHPQDRRITPTEMQVYNIKAAITSFHREANGDYRLLAQDTRGNRVVTEIPDPRCIGEASPFLPLIRTARAYVKQHWHRQPSTDIPASITGVAFFDSHKVVGAAPNSIELQPVLKIKFLR